MQNFYLSDKFTTSDATFNKLFKQFACTNYTKIRQKTDNSVWIYKSIIVFLKHDRKRNQSWNRDRAFYGPGSGFIFRTSNRAKEQ